MDMDMFVALADPTRRNILELLASSGELPATAIYERFSVSPQAISQHLKVLREARLVDMEKRAQKHLYRLNPHTLSEFESWVQRMQQRWSERFEALDEVLETEKRYRGARTPMNMKLELVPIPVSDVDRAKAFYAEKIGFHVDHDVQPGNGMRVVQLTPQGSACSIVIGMGMGEITDMQPGTIKGLHLVVADIQQAREALVGKGVQMGEVDDLGGIKYARFSDPDGNSWLLQEISGH